jgi:hypothetical protein
MKNFLLATIVAILAVGCSSNTRPTLTSEEMRTTSINALKPVSYPDQSNRPEWVMSEPLLDGDLLFFTGVSSLYATEKSARRDAKRDALFSGMEYLSTIAKAKYEQAEMGFGLDGATLSPTIGTRGYYKFVHMNVLKGARTTKWYFEREADMVGRPGYKYFALVAMPKKDFFKAFSNTAKTNVFKAQTEAGNAVNEVAKAQAIQSMEFWKLVEEEGITEDDFFTIPKGTVPKTQ